MDMKRHRGLGGGKEFPVPLRVDLCACHLPVSLNSVSILPLLCSVSGIVFPGGFGQWEALAEGCRVL